MNDKRTGRFLLLPFDWRRPTAAKVKGRAWDVDNHHVFVPKAFGWGYSLNFAELARRLRLRR